MSNAASEKEKQIVERQARRRERDLRSGINYLLADKKGQDFLWWLLSESHMFRTTFTGNSQGAFLEGERNLGLRVYHKIIETNPEAYLDMQLRQHQQTQKDEQEILSADKGNEHDE